MSFFLSLPLFGLACFFFFLLCVSVAGWWLIAREPSNAFFLFLSRIPFPILPVILDPLFLFPPFLPRLSRSVCTILGEALFLHSQNCCPSLAAAAAAAATAVFFLPAHNGVAPSSLFFASSSSSASRRMVDFAAVAVVAAAAAAAVVVATYMNGMGKRD